MQLKLLYNHEKIIFSQHEEKALESGEKVALLTYSSTGRYWDLEVYTASPQKNSSPRGRTIPIHSDLRAILHGVTPKNLKEKEERTKRIIQLIERSIDPILSGEAQPSYYFFDEKSAYVAHRGDDAPSSHQREEESKDLKELTQCIKLFKEKQKEIATYVNNMRDASWFGDSLADSKKNTAIELLVEIKNSLDVPSYSLYDPTLTNLIKKMEDVNRILCSKEFSKHANVQRKTFENVTGVIVSTALNLTSLVQRASNRLSNALLKDSNIALQKEIHIIKQDMSYAKNDLSSIKKMQSEQANTMIQHGELLNQHTQNMKTIQVGFFKEMTEMRRSFQEDMKNMRAAFQEDMKLAQPIAGADQRHKISPSQPSTNHGEPAQ